MPSYALLWHPPPVCTRRPLSGSHRNYLYARQCVLLRKLDRTPEIAQRTINFLFNTINELRLMRLEIQRGKARHANTRQTGVQCTATVQFARC